MRRALRPLSLNAKVELRLSTRKNDGRDSAGIRYSANPSEKYSSELSLRLAKGSTPTIAVRYCAARLEVSRDSRSLSAPPGFQAQTLTVSSMFLKRKLPASANTTDRCLLAS